jgi:hypothetical protein
MTSKSQKPDLFQTDIYRKAAEIQQRMYDEWDEEAIDHIAQKLIEDGKSQ